MAKISKIDFVAGLKKSRLVESDKLETLLGGIDEDTAEAVAKQLIREGLATKWQAKYLMSGRTRLDIGSYRLLERISRDEFGDRFLAVHTSLARKVDLQVLPGSLTKDKTSCDLFIKKASLAAKLDHPNLTHVYDIDQEGGRYFLVTEHIEGKSLDGIDGTGFSQSDIAHIVKQAIDGIAYAHKHDVIHGCIGPSDLVLDDSQQIKIQHLPLSPLRQQSNGSSAVTSTVKDDFSSLARIGTNLLKNSSEIDAEQSSDLKNAFANLSRGTAEAIDAASKSLASLVEISSVPEAFEVEVAGGFDQPIASTGAVRKKKKIETAEPVEPKVEVAEPGYMGRLWRDNPMAVLATAGVFALILVGGSIYGTVQVLGNSSKQTAQTENSNPLGAGNAGSQNEQPSNAKKLSSKRTNNVDLAPPTAEEMEKVFASLESGERKLGGKGNGKKKNDTNQVVDVKLGKPPIKNDPAVPSGKGNAANKLVPKEKTSPAVAENNSKPPGGAANATPDLTNVSTQSNAQNDNATKTVAVDTNNKQPAATEPKTNPADTPSNPAGNVAAAANPAATTEPTHLDLTMVGGIGKKTQTVLQQADVKSLEKLASMSPGEIQQVITKGGLGQFSKFEDYKRWITQAKRIVGDETPMKMTPVATDAPAETVAVANTPPPNATGPFAKFPRVISLPPTEDTIEKKIGDLVIKAQYLLGAELVCEEGFAKGKTVFELERTSEDKQKWLVGLKKSARHDPIHIATFRKSPEAVFFQWLPEATTNKDAKKLAGYLRNCFLKLKLPGDESTYVTLRTPIKIPDLRLTETSLVNQIEFAIPDIPRDETIVVEVMPMQIPNVETAIPNSRIERAIPARIWLKRNDKTGFLWIQVAGDLRSKLKLQSNLVVLMQGNVTPVPSLQSLAELSRTVDIAYNLAQRAHDQFQKPKEMPKGEFDNKKKKLLQDANSKKATKEKLIGYSQQLPKILNQPIRVRVYSKLGNFQTMLAVTDPTLPQDKK